MQTDLFGIIDMSIFKSYFSHIFTDFCRPETDSSISRLSSAYTNILTHNVDCVATDVIICDFVN